MKPQPIRGMNDILPEKTATWRFLENVLRETAEAYGYREIRVPVIEQTELFARSIGEATDIVEKEMYSFRDRNDLSLTLRPEATASIARAGITNGLLHNQRQKLWTSGPMFRYEKPQKGRYRQFHQFDVEALGFEGPDIDAELIVMCARLWRRLGLKRIHLEINTLGSDTARKRYREALVGYFSGVKNRLDDDSIRRLDKNPLRILDSKNPDLAEIVAAAPSLLDYLDEESAAHFEGLKALLDAAGVAYTVNPRLVRGLDYYNRTVFEWVTDALGAQGAVCSGGRYDGLVSTIGGRATPAIGWALGLERLVELFEASGGEAPGCDPDVYVVAVGEDALAEGFRLAEALRDRGSDRPIRAEVNLGGGSFKSQLKRADKSGAEYAVILGEEEVASARAGLKPLRTTGEQLEIGFADLADDIAARLAAARPQDN